MQIILVRHGRTALNAEGRLRGLADPELDDTGVAQAEATAAALRSFGISRALSSPLRRAIRTATIIADASGVGHAVDPAFQDRDYGKWTGRLRTEVVATFGSVDAAPGVEPSDQVRDRAMRGLDALALSPEPGPIVVVTHDAVIRPVLQLIEPGPAVTADNGSWSVIEHDGAGWRVVSMDQTP